MPTTAFRHFKQDIGRAQALLGASSSVASSVNDDVLRSAWMLAVGAVDAYFCDAYADLIATCLIAKERQRGVRLPSSVGAIGLPVEVYFSSHAKRQNWRWRMAARRVIERDNVLSIQKMQDLINPFLRIKHRLFSDVLNDWMKDRDATARCFGTSGRTYIHLSPSQRKKCREAAGKKLKKRFGEIFQRRHDCIHNCDRPKFALQAIRFGSARNVIFDIRFIVRKTEVHLVDEYPKFLRSLGCSQTTINNVGY